MRASAALVSFGAAVLTAAQRPTILYSNDTGSGTASIGWTPTAGAASYLVSAEAFSFQETFPGGALTPGGARMHVATGFPRNTLLVRPPRSLDVRQHPWPRLQRRDIFFFCYSLPRKRFAQYEWLCGWWKVGQPSTETQR